MTETLDLLTAARADHPARCGHLSAAWVLVGTAGAFCGPCAAELLADGPEPLCDLCGALRGSDGRVLVACINPHTTITASACSRCLKGLQS